MMPIRKYLVVVLLLLTALLKGRSQQYVSLLNLDSLKKRLSVAKDTDHINTLTLIAMRTQYGEQRPGYLDSAARYAAQARVLSKMAGYNKGLGNAILNEGMISLARRDNFHTTLASLQTALPLLKQGRDFFSVAACFQNMGDCIHQVGNNKKAILYFDSSEHLFKQLGDTISAIWTMMNEGHSYFDLGNYASAYRIFRTAQDAAPKTDTLLQSLARVHLAKLFLGAHLPEVTLDYVQQVKKYNPLPFQQTNLPWPAGWAIEVAGEAFLQLHMVDSAWQVAQFLNIPLKDQDSDDNSFYGHVYAALQQYDKALVYFKKGYQVSINAGHEIALARHAVGLATTYLALGDFKQSIHYATEGLHLAENIQALLEQTQAAATLSDIYKQTNNYKKADQYNQLYKTLSDSLAPETYRRRLALLQVQEALDQQKQQAVLLGKEKIISQQQLHVQEAQLKTKSLLLYVSVAAMLLGVLIAMLITRNARLQKRKQVLQHEIEKAGAELEQSKKEQQLAMLQNDKQELEMQVLRAQMNPHFIFNCLSSINRYILINRKEEASDYLTKFSRLMRMALHNSEKSMISLEAELEALRLYLELERLRFKNAFSYSITVINSIETSTLFVPPLLLQPFAENAIWHGLMHKQGEGKLDIALHLQDSMLHCTITDNGIGRKQAALLKSKNGENYKSIGMQKTVERLSILTGLSGEQNFFSIEDMEDETGAPTGTKVLLKIRYQSLAEAS